MANKKIRPNKVRVHPEFRRMLWDLKAMDPDLSFIDITERMTKLKSHFKDSLQLEINKKKRGKTYWKL